MALFMRVVIKLIFTIAAERDAPATTITTTVAACRQQQETRRAAAKYMQIFFYDQKAQVSLSMGTNRPASASRREIFTKPKKETKMTCNLGREMMIRSP